MKRHCPACDSTSTKKNCHIHNGKQNHYCKECGRQFVSKPEQILISDAKRERIRKLLLERIPLRGICRVQGVSLRWLLSFIVGLYDQLPSDLNFQLKGEADELIFLTLESEIDEMFSFVGSKANKQWIWIAMDTKSRQIVAFHVGDRSGQSLKPCSSQYPSATGSMPRSIPMTGVRMRVWFHKSNISRQKAKADNQSHRAIQLYQKTKGISFGPAVSFLFQEVGKSHWRDKIFHLPL